MLAYCPSSNMVLGDGITRITEMVVKSQRLTTMGQAQVIERVRRLTSDWSR